jgi:hypothetical protein
MKWYKTSIPQSAPTGLEIKTSIYRILFIASAHRLRCGFQDATDMTQTGMECCNLCVRVPAPTIALLKYTLWTRLLIPRPHLAPLTQFMLQSLETARAFGNSSHMLSTWASIFPDFYSLPHDHRYSLIECFTLDFVAVCDGTRVHDGEYSFLSPSFSPLLSQG